MVLRPRDRVRESITRGEGISTPHARSTLRYPLLLSILWVCLIYAYCLLLLKGECMQKKGEKKCRENKIMLAWALPQCLRILFEESELP